MLEHHEQGKVDVFCRIPVSFREKKRKAGVPWSNIIKIGLLHMNKNLIDELRDEIFVKEQNITRMQEKLSELSSKVHEQSLKIKFLEGRMTKEEYLSMVEEHALITGRKPSTGGVRQW